MKYAKGVDLLIHTVAGLRQELLDSAKFWGVIMAHHATPEDAGRVFTKARPKLAVYTHLALLTNGKIKPLSYKEVIEATRKTYDGPVVVGKDLMTIVIGKDGVTTMEHKK